MVFKLNIAMHNVAGSGFCWVVLPGFRNSHPLKDGLMGETLGVNMFHCVIADKVSDLRGGFSFNSTVASLGTHLA